MTPPAGRTRIPALDGLRGLAVAAVLAYHAELPWARGGFLGVSAFFTLSGFLIAGLLVDELEQTGRVDLLRFWSRRARRLVPAALVTLAAVLLFGATVATAGQRADLRGDVLAALGYVANWRFVAGGGGYADLFAAPSPVQHFWSLAVEEQFYLGFPLMLVGAWWAGRGRRRAVGALLLGGVAASVAAMLLVGGGTDRRYYGTDTRAAEILIGALLAVVGVRASVLVRRAVGPLALLVLLGAWATIGLGDGWLLQGGLAVHAAAVAFVIAVAVAGGPVATILSTAPLRWLGRVSYGAYLFHWPLFLWLTPLRTGLSPAPLAALRLAATLGLAAISHRLIEEPIRRGERLRPAPARRLALAGAAAVVAGVLALPGASAPRRASFETVSASAANVPSRPVAEAAAPVAPVAEVADAVLADAVLAASRPEVTAPEAAPPLAPPPTAPPVASRRPGPLRVHVVGDSVALSLGVPLQDWGAAHGIVVHTQAWNACAVARGGAYRYAGIEKAMEDRCDTWETTRAADIDKLAPDLVLVSHGTFDVLDRRLPGTDHWQHLGQPAYDRYFRDEARRLTQVLGHGGARVLWLVAPHVAIGSTQDGIRPRTPFPESDPARIDRFNAIIREVVADTPGAALIDLQGRMRAWPGGELDPRRRPDGVHPTWDAAVELVAWLGPQLEAYRPPA